MISKKIKLNKDVSASTIFIQDVCFLILKSKGYGSYFKIGSGVCLSYDSKQNSLDLAASDDNLSLPSLHVALLEFCSALEAPFRKVILLRGLGFRMNTTSDDLVEFKLGKSHRDFLSTKGLNLNVKIKKQRMLVESINKCDIGNFLDKVISLKAPDSYKGKGFSLKYKVQRLKQIKK